MSVASNAVIKKVDLRFLRGRRNRSNGSNWISICRWITWHVGFEMLSMNLI